MKTRILIIDDEPDFTMMMKLTLETEGDYEVQEENNALNALHTAQKFRPDVVVLDVMMPEISGLEVAESFSKDPQLKDVPILFISALVRQNAPPPRFPLSMMARHTFLPKPVSAEVLLTSIRKAAEPATA